VCTRVGNQRCRDVVTARIRTDVVRSLHHQRRDLHQSTYSIPLRRSGLILCTVRLLAISSHYPSTARQFQPNLLACTDQDSRPNERNLVQLSGLVLVLVLGSSDLSDLPNTSHKKVVKQPATSKTPLTTVAWQPQLSTTITVA
jgi:hypothetical protein